MFGLYIFNSITLHSHYVHIHRDRYNDRGGGGRDRDDRGGGGYNRDRRDDDR